MSDKHGSGGRSAPIERVATAADERSGGDDRRDRPGSDGERVLQERFDTVDRAEPFYETAMRSSLTDRMRSFLRARWLGFVGWLGADGPRVTAAVGDRGLVRILDDETVAWPVGRTVDELPSFEGSRAERHVSLVTVDWWDSTVGLHVNGVAERRSVRPGGASDADAAGDWIVLEIEEAYIHCAKHIPRLTVAASPPDRPSAPASLRVADHLSAETKRFVESRILGVLGTADRRGETDVSPRLGPEGFVQVVDDTTLAWPEYRGNGVHASLGNIYERPTASMLFVDWWNAEAIVHVSGTASIRDAVEGATDLTDVDRTKSWVVLDVESVTVAVEPPIPRLAIEEFDPPWGTDDGRAKKRGFFTA